MQEKGLTTETLTTLRTFEHEGMVFELFDYGAGMPQSAKGSARRIPGAGKLEVAGVEVSLRDGWLEFTARITGSSVAYVYTEVLLKDPDLDRYYGPVLRDHVRAACDQVVRGVRRPCWETSIEVVARARLELPVLTDGSRAAFCFSLPERYGDPGRLLTGLYTPAGGAAPLRATLFLGEGGTIRRLLAYREQGRRSMPRGVDPDRGDTFIPFVQVLTQAPGKTEWEVGTALSTTLRFGDGTLRVIGATPLPGDYLAGVVVHDFDGWSTRAYVPMRLP
jgi:hypothetical protein